MERNQIICAATSALVLTSAYFAYSYKTMYDDLLVKHDAEKCFCKGQTEEATEVEEPQEETVVTTEE